MLGVFLQILFDSRKSVVVVFQQACLQDKLSVADV